MVKRMKPGRCQKRNKSVRTTEDSTKEDPCNGNMSEECVRIADIADRHALQLCQAISTGCMQRHEHRPDDAATEEADE